MLGSSRLGGVLLHSTMDLSSRGPSHTLLLLSCHSHHANAPDSCTCLIPRAGGGELGTATRILFYV